MQVALRLKAKGTSARTGSVIPYIFCIGEGEESAKSAQADRAKHPDEIRRSEGQLKIGGSCRQNTDSERMADLLSVDFEYYLAHQILPPIERLCDPIEGTDRSRLAECLGEFYQLPSSLFGPC